MPVRPAGYRGRLSRADEDSGRVEGQPATVVGVDWFEDDQKFLERLKTGHQHWAESVAEIFRSRGLEVVLTPMRVSRGHRVKARIRR